MPSKINFSVDARLLQELGEGLVGKPSTALAELIKNAYDADATLVKVNGLKQKILELLQSQSDILTIHYELLNQNPDLFGTFRRKHLTKALSELQEEGCIELDGAPSKEITKVYRLK
ncbi:hypothetical protein ATHL_02330 [Anaerolinea thermolimosa]|uniref:hypothetical protein n=1 Tax=Anaerolinea thermolimosa TaxID=229919 RepID=UPI000785E2DC|nr:hypothetical protein [Anaerolinea thermolimosa]GAP07448.1 hypothetical protein ATHL_02330 [Anaerolinea thermolimosa]